MGARGRRPPPGTPSYLSQVAGSCSGQLGCVPTSCRQTTRRSMPSGFTVVLSLYEQEAVHSPSPLARTWTHSIAVLNCLHSRQGTGADKHRVTAGVASLLQDLGLLFWTMKLRTYNPHLWHTGEPGWVDRLWVCGLQDPRPQRQAGHNGAARSHWNTYCVLPLAGRSALRLQFTCLLLLCLSLLWATVAWVRTLLMLWYICRRYSWALPQQLPPTMLHSLSAATLVWYAHRWTSMPGGVAWC